MNFTETLTRWYSVNKREMPWRKTKNPYFIWLSEIILQQTQVKQGLPYYKVFVNTFPVIEDLANANEEYILKLWQGLGYYSRARNLHSAARYVVEELNGNFPTTYQSIKKLKGVGDYTASAIASICFNEPTAVVDGNVYRVLSRVFGIKTPINSTQGIKEFKALAQKFIDVNNPGDYNQAIMEFGAMQCKPSNPDCKACPFISNCVAYKEDMIGELPVKLKKLKVKKKHFNYMVVLSKHQETILNKRVGKGIWQNLYEFPLIESNKPLTQRAITNHHSFKHLIKEQDFDICLFNKKVIIHKLSHQHLYTKFWIVTVDKIIDKTTPISDIKNYPVPILISNFIDNYRF